MSQVAAIKPIFIIITILLFGGCAGGSVAHDDGGGTDVADSAGSEESADSPDTTENSQNSEEFVDPQDISSNTSDPVLLVWVPYWDQPRAMSSYQQHHDKITHVSFFWYYLDDNGDVKKYRYADTNLNHIAQVHNNNDKAYAIIANLPDLNPDDPNGGWKRDRVRAMMESDTGRNKHIDDLVRLAVDNNFDGINIDYENLRRDDRALYTDFVAQLSGSLNDAGKDLALALHPKTTEFSPAEDNGSHAQDWTKLADYASQLHIMAYGEHYPGSAPGPIASNEWLNRIIGYLDSLAVDKEKFVMGIPLYGEVWSIDEQDRFMGISGDFNYQGVQKFRNDHNGVEENLDEIGANRLSFSDDDGDRFIVYFENASSTESKLRLSRGNGIENFAFWRIGGEDPLTWQLIDPP